jgi:sensor histidine kinase YesM
MTTRTRYVLRMAVINIAAAIFVVAAFTGVGLDTPWRRGLPFVAVALLFSMCIGIPCSVLLPRIALTLWRLRFPFNWAALVAVMFAITVPGSILAISILVAVGYVPPSDFLQWVRGSFRYSIITTLTFGLAVSAYEMMRARLDQATVELRIKERDEAEAQRLAAKAQLTSLESRVQPHFLFNTLNSIASLIHSDPKGAEKMTGQLASLLRSSLESAESPLVSLEQELKTVREYVDIEQVRFGNRLRCAFDVDERAQSAMVPRFALQTLVENAVKYAVSPRREGGRIIVRTRAADGRVRLEVEDDGPGFDPEAVKDHHGLEVLRARLALTFGDRARLEIRGSPGEMVVGIEMPRSG